MDPDTIPANYLDRRTALETLGVSEATLDRMASDGRVASKTEPRPGRKPERVYSAQDVERLKAEKEKRREARPPSALAPKTQLMLPAFDGVAEAMRELASSLAYRVDDERERSENFTLREKLWLTLEEAAAYSGLARRDLVRLRREGKLVARKSGGWKYLRRSLEEFAG